MWKTLANSSKSVNSLALAAPAGEQQRASFNCHRQDYKFVVSCRILAFCENSNYYLSLKLNTVLLPETTLYSSLPRSLQPDRQTGHLTQAHQVGFTLLKKTLQLQLSLANCRECNHDPALLAFLFSLEKDPCSDLTLSRHECPICFQVTVLRSGHSRSCKLIVLPVN